MGSTSFCEKPMRLIQQIQIIEIVVLSVATLRKAEWTLAVA